MHETIEPLPIEFRHRLTDIRGHLDKVITGVEHNRLCPDCIGTETEWREEQLWWIEFKISVSLLVRSCSEY